MTKGFTILAGLPSTGPMAESFPPSQLLAREGLVVRFDTANHQHWLVNFKKGNSDFDKILPHPDGEQVVLCAGGNVYVVDPEKKSVTSKFDYVFYLEAIPELDIVLLGDLFRFIALDTKGVRWKTTNRFGDGFRNVKHSKNTLTGESFSTLDDKWHHFEVDLLTGACNQTAYEQQLARFIPIVVRKDD